MTSAAMQTTLHVMLNSQVTISGQFERVTRAGEMEPGGSTSCRMKAWLTFAGRSEETKVNIKRFHQIYFFCEVPVDEYGAV